ncbi:hypothetical protein Bca101_040110 [Brassica carinata]
MKGRLRQKTSRKSYFLEVVWKTSWKSSGRLPGSRLEDFLERMQALSSLQRETAMCTLPAKDSSRKTLIRLQLASGYDHVRGAWMRSCCRSIVHIIYLKSKDT